jgi:hypothetical protein
MPFAIPFLIAAAVKIAITVAINAVLSLIAKVLTGGPPKPEQAKAPIKQPVPPQQYAYGQGRVSGPYIFWVTVPKYTLDVIAVVNGPIDSYIGFYLNDDYVPIASSGSGLRVDPTSHGVTGGADGRYSGANLFNFDLSPVHIYWQVGDNPATAFADVVRLSQGQWTSSHRGDGVATIALICSAVKQEDQQKVFPNTEPALSAVAKWSKVYDWRKDSSLGFSPGGAQRRDDPDTWEWSENAVVCHIHDEWFARGQDWDFRFAPTLDFLTTAADVCDERVPLKAGGDQAKYTLFGWYQRNNANKDIRTNFLDCYDGYMIERGDGAFVLKAGKYEEPTVVLDEDRILEFAWHHSRRLDETANRLVLSFNSPDLGYTMVEADPWYDQAAIDAGAPDNSLSQERPWVTNNGQTRRLAKRAMARIKAPYQGYVVIDLSDDGAELEQRYLRLKNRRGPSSMYDTVVEIVGASLDLVKRQVHFDIVLADQDIDEWDAATEEGNAPDAPASATPATVPVPLVVSITSFSDDSGNGTAGPRLMITLEDINRLDLSDIVSWRVTGTDLWSDETSRFPASDGDSPPTVSFPSGFVPSVVSLDVRVAALGSAGQSLWTSTHTVNTQVTTPAPAAPTGLATSHVGSPTHNVGLQATASNSLAWAAGRFWRSATNTFGTAVDISGPLYGPANQPFLYTDVHPGAGTWFYWATGESATGNQSAPTPSQSIVVT